MKPRKWKMWAGYYDGRIDLITFASGMGGTIYGVVYPRRYLARRAYQDVRAVEVSELPKRKAAARGRG